MERTFFMLFYRVCLTLQVAVTIKGGKAVM